MVTHFATVVFGAAQFSPNSREIAFSNLDPKDGKPAGIYIMSASGEGAGRGAPLTTLGHKLTECIPIGSARKVFVLAHATSDYYNYGTFYTVIVNGGKKNRSPTWKITPSSRTEFSRSALHGAPSSKARVSRPRRDYFS